MKYTIKERQNAGISCFSMKETNIVSMRFIPKDRTISLNPRFMIKAVVGEG